MAIVIVTGTVIGTIAATEASGAICPSSASGIITITASMASATGITVSITEVQGPFGVGSGIFLTIRLHGRGASVTDDDIHHWHLERARLAAMLEELSEDEGQQRKRIEMQIAAIDKHLAAIRARRH